MLGRGQALEYAEPPCAQAEVVKTAAEGLPPELDDAKASAVGAVGRRCLFEGQNAVRQAGDLLIFSAASVVVEEQHRALTLGEELLQTQQLAPIANR